MALHDWRCACELQINQIICMQEIAHRREAGAAYAGLPAAVNMPTRTARSFNAYVPAERIVVGRESPLRARLTAGGPATCLMPMPCGRTFGSRRAGVASGSRAR
jgi:hypothetical protein